MGCKIIILFISVAILFIFAGIILPLSNVPQGIYFLYLIPVVVFGFLAYQRIALTRMVNKLKQSINLGETLVAEGSAGPDPAILIQTSPGSFRLLAADLFKKKENTSMQVLEIGYDAFNTKDPRERSNYIEMSTDSGDVVFTPHKGITKFGQRAYAQKVIDILVANGVPVSGMPDTSTIIERIQEKALAKGLTTLSPTEKVIYTVQRLEKRMVDGGFHLLFSSSAAELPLDPVEALEEINAQDSAAVIRRARNLIPAIVRVDEISILQWQKTADSLTLNSLGQLDEEFHTGSDLRYELLAKYCRARVDELRASGLVKKT